jgi:hypothetical protein
MNVSRTVGRFNLILFALESVFEDASFDYNKHIIRYNLIFDLKGGPRLFRVRFYKVKSDFEPKPLS